MVFLLSAIAQATPGKATWTRVIFVGANATHYCTYLIVRDQPGSYYEYTDRVYLCQYALKDNGLVDKQLVRETVYRDTTTNGDWRKQDKLPDPVNAERYLIENKMYFLFPSDDLDDYKPSINWRGIFLTKDRKARLLLSGESITQMAPGFTMELEGYGHSKILNYYRGSGYYFFHIQYGEAAYDGPFDQAIILVPKAAIEKVTGRR